MPGKKPFPLLPTRLGLIIIVTAILMTTLYFDYSQGSRGTNPVTFYIIPIIFLAVAMEKDSWLNIKDAWGFHFETWKDKLISLSSIPLGIMGGIGVYTMMSQQLGIIPLWFPEFIAETPLIQNAIFFGVVAFGEEIFTIVIGKNIANWLAVKAGFSETPAIFGSFLLSRSIWALSHVFAYGLQNPMSFVVAFVLGMFFTLGGFTLGSLSGKKWNIVFPILAHWQYNVMTSLSLICIFPLCF